MHDTQHADLFVNCLPYVYHILNHFVDNRIIFQEPAVHSVVEHNS
jgi:hypothetical protein